VCVFVLGSECHSRQVRTCPRVDMYVCVFVCLYHGYPWAFVCACVCVHILVSDNTRIHTYIHIHADKRSLGAQFKQQLSEQAYIYIYIYIHIHTCIHAYIHVQADKRSLGAQFKQQLSELIKLIESGRAHYVRCVKPNSLVRCICMCVCMNMCVCVLHAYI
jgi:hypothetical protein